MHMTLFKTKIFIAINFNISLNDFIPQSMCVGRRKNVGGKLTRTRGSPFSPLDKARKTTPPRPSWLPPFINGGILSDTLSLL